MLLNKRRMKDLTNKHLDENGHLKEGAIALYVDAIKLARLSDLPADLYEHVQNCMTCSADVSLLEMLLADEDYSEMPTHPVLGEAKSNFSITADDTCLDQILEKLKEEAATIPIYERLIEDQVTYRNLYVAVIKVQSPDPSTLCTDFVDFRFATESEKPVTLIVENQKEQVLKTTLDADSGSYKLQFQPHEKFPSGLYYWKAALKGGKPILGKFFVYNPRPEA